MQVACILIHAAHGKWVPAALAWRLEPPEGTRE